MSPELLGRLLAAVPGGVLLLDSNGIVAECNPAAERILGRSREQIREFGLADLAGDAIGEDGNPLPFERLPHRRTLASGLAHHDVIGIRHRDGGHRWLEVHSEPVGRPMCAILLRIAEKSEPLADVLRHCVERAPLPIRLAGPEGQLEFFNREWVEYAGLGGVGEHGTAWLARIHPEDAEGMQAAFRKALDGTDRTSAEYRVRGADDQYRWFLEHFGQRSNAAGRPAGLIGIAVDVDGHQKQQDRLQTLSRALEQTAARIVVTDAQGCIEYVNPTCCRDYGYRAEELAGQNPRLFKSQETAPATYRELWDTLLAGETWRGELTNRTRDGRHLTEAVTISPVRDESGRTRHYVAVKEDISGERAAQRAQRELDGRLARLDRMRTVNALAGGLAHEFNNILVAILGFSDLGVRLMSAGGDPRRVAHYLEEIRNAGERARRLVAQLRAFGRAGEANVSRLDVAELLADTLPLLDAALPPGQQLSSRVEADLPAVQVDRGAIQQMIVNLCLNAADAMPEGGSIVISVRRYSTEGSIHCNSCHRDFHGEYLCIEVADSGGGIHEAVNAHLFEPFFSTKEVAAGSGMGLAVVHGTAHQFGGHLVVHSSPADGTRVQVLLPLSDREGPA